MIEWLCLLLGSCLQPASLPVAAARPAAAPPPALQVYQRQADDLPGSAASPFQPPARQQVAASPAAGVPGGEAASRAAGLLQVWRLAGVLQDTGGARALLEQGGRFYTLTQGERLPGEMVRISAIEADRLIVQHEALEGLQQQTLHLGIASGGQ